MERCANRRTPIPLGCKRWGGCTLGQTHRVLPNNRRLFQSVTAQFTVCLVNSLDCNANEHQKADHKHQNHSKRQRKPNFLVFLSLSKTDGWSDLKSSTHCKMKHCSFMKQISHLKIHNEHCFKKVHTKKLFGDALPAGALSRQFSY